MKRATAFDQTGNPAQAAGSMGSAGARERRFGETAASEGGCPDQPQIDQTPDVACASQSLPAVSTPLSG